MAHACCISDRCIATEFEPSLKGHPNYCTRCAQAADWVKNMSAHPTHFTWMHSRPIPLGICHMPLMGPCKTNRHRAVGTWLPAWALSVIVGNAAHCEPRLLVKHWQQRRLPQKHTSNSSAERAAGCRSVSDTVRGIALLQMLHSLAQHMRSA